jgi:hypothetical protein
MEGLLRRLSDGDAEAEDALRVVLFFDRLVASRAGVADLLTSAARLIGGAAGYSPAKVGAVHESMAFDGLGEPLAAPAIKRRARAVDQRLPARGEVWIEEAELSLSELILERLAIAAGIILARIGAASATLEDDPMLILIGGEADPGAVGAATRALNIRSDWQMRVLICWSPRPQQETRRALSKWAEAAGLWRTPFTADGNYLVGMVRSEDLVDEDSLPGQMLLASGPRRNVLEDAASYAGAQQAIRLTSLQLGPKVLDYDALGPLVHIASLRPDEAGTSELVKMFQFMMQTPAGRSELLALDVFCRLGGVRAASTAMHMHHSSLSNRLRNAERRLSLSVNEPQARLQVTLALQLLRSTQWASAAEPTAGRVALSSEQQ